MPDKAFARIVEQVPYAGFLGVQLHESGEMLELPFRQELVGNARLPALHGGVVAGFAEASAMLWLLLREGEIKVPNPIDFSVDYLRSARAQTTFAACEVLRQGRRVAQVSVRCWQDDPARPVAVTRSHFLLQPLTSVGHTNPKPAEN